MRQTDCFRAEKRHAEVTPVFFASFLAATEATVNEKSVLCCSCKTNRGNFHLIFSNCLIAMSCIIVTLQVTEKVANWVTAYQSSVYYSEDSFVAGLPGTFMHNDNVYV
jgi:hypothetical protein